MGVSTSDICFTLHDVAKTLGTRQLFEGVTLSFLRGARIGVIGPNGMGKSTLLRIISGEDTEFDGTAQASPGVTIGYVHQEPQLDPELTVMENVEKAVEPIREMTRKYEEISARMGEDISEDEMTDLLEKMSRLQEEIDAKDAWELDRHIEQAMMALRLPPAEQLGRRTCRVARSVASPSAAALHRAAGPAPARRADQPPGRGDRRVARAAPAGLQRAPSCSSPMTATSSTTWSAGCSRSTAAS